MSRFDGLSAFSGQLSAGFLRSLELTADTEAEVFEEGSSCGL
jgi:hypothetical protein